MASGEIKSVADAKLSQGMRVLLRADFNVPCAKGIVESDYRIRRALPTLELLSRLGCRTVIVSHLDENSGTTLAPVAEYLNQKIPVAFAGSLKAAEQQAKKLQEGTLLLVENIRREKGETENSEAFAHRLAKLGDIYVNEAFAVSHRRHASIVGVPKILPSYAGLLFVAEIRHLRSALSPENPALFVLGGAKFETKLPLLVKLLERYANIFVGGALANDIFKSMGREIGLSKASSFAPDLKKIIKSSRVRMPIDVMVKRGDGVVIISPEEVKVSDTIVDVGPETSALLEELARRSKFILWNGPLGICEDGFARGTEHLAKAIATSGAQSILGGGDTVAAVEKSGLTERFGFVSTGGGAMLEFLANETLPGIEALAQNNL